MGKCWKCEKEILLQGGESKCPNCDSEINYNCWKCGNHFFVKDTKECTWCGFYFCPNCKVCGMNCESEVHIKNTLNLDTFKTTQYFGNLIHNPIHKNCPRGVPVTHAKKNLVSYALKLQGRLCKNTSDTEAYRQRHAKIINQPIGTICTINNMRESGFDGKETRTDLLLAVCEGYYYLNEQINPKTKKSSLVFTRCEKKNACPHLQYHKLIVNGKRSRCELCQLGKSDFVIKP